MSYSYNPKYAGGQMQIKVRPYLKVNGKGEKKRTRLEPYPKLLSISLTNTKTCIQTIV
jgi:hypothetical protein